MLSFASFFSPLLGTQHFSPIMECCSTSMLQNYTFYSSHMEAFWKMSPLFTVVLTVRAFSHWPSATQLLNKWLYWEFRQCGQWENPVTHELLSIPGFPKSFCSTLLPVVRLCWAFEWVMGKQGLRDYPSVQGGDKHLFPSSALRYFRSQLPAFTHSQVLADWGVLLGMVKVMSALSEFHQKSEGVLVWSGQSSWCGWQGHLDRDRKAGEVIVPSWWSRKKFSQVSVKSSAAAPGELPKLLHHSTGAQHFSSSWAKMSDFSRAASPQGCPRKCLPLSAALIPQPGSIWLFTLS